MDFLTLAIILAASAMFLLALIMSVTLGWAKDTFKVYVDPRIDAINSALPGANCGGCGYVGCNDYAEAIVKDGAEVNLCPPGGEASAQAVANIMGIEVGETLPYRPVVHCVATYEQRLKRHEYKGEQTCIAANMVAGVQGCVYGCLGFGDCKDVCNYDAIKIVDGLSTIDYDNCVGCAACAKICPRNIISMIPFKYERVLTVRCSNKDFGKEVMDVCTVGCIGCKACTKQSEMFSMEGNVPVIDYDKFSPTDESIQRVFDKCPRESLMFIGKPTDKHRETHKDTDLPDKVEADFKTTVDDAEWRG